MWVDKSREDNSAATPVASRSLLGSQKLEAPGLLRGGWGGWGGWGGYGCPVEGHPRWPQAKTWDIANLGVVVKNRVTPKWLARAVNGTKEDLTSGPILGG